MTYWETLEENRKRVGLPAEIKAEVRKNEHAEKKDKEPEDKRGFDSALSNSIWANLKWMKVNDGTYRLYVPSGSEYNLFNMVRVSLANPIDARFNVPLLENPTDNTTVSSWTQRLANLAKQYGNMVSISVVPKTDDK